MKSLDDTTYLEQGEEISVVVLDLLPFLDKWWHNDVDELFLVNSWANNISQSADSVVKKQQVAMLILFKCFGERHENRMKVWDKFNGNTFLEK